MVFYSNAAIKNLGYLSTTDFLQVQMNNIGSGGYSIRIEQEGVYFDFDADTSVGVKTMDALKDMNRLIHLCDNLDSHHIVLRGDINAQ